MKNNLKVIMASVIVSLLPLSCFAENYGFLSNSAMSYFTKEDWQIFNKTRDIALRSRDNVKVSWSNPKSGSHGYMIPSSAPSQNGMQCRYIAFFNTANLVDGEGSYKFCKSNNQWKIY